MLAALLALAGLATGGDPAAGAATSGAITGHITAEGGGLVPGDTYVTLGHPDGSLVAGRAELQAGLSYVWPDLAPGDYVVEAWPGSQPTDLVPGYHGGPTLSTATVVHVAPGASVSGVDVELRIGATVTGTVTAPPGSSVEGFAVIVAGDHGDLLSASLGADGHFALSGLPTGSIRLRVEPSSWNSVLAPRWYGGSYQRATATPIAVTAGRTTSGIDVALEVGGSITGRVTGPDGTPLAGAGVTAWQLAEAGPWGADQWSDTDADGTYRLDGLRPGDYQVVFSEHIAEDGTTHAGEVFDDEAGYAWFGGVPLSVSLGRTRTGVDAQLELAGGVSVQPRTSSGGLAVGERIDLAESASAPATEWTTAFADDAGSATFSSLRSGHGVYVAVARASADTPYVRQYYRSGGVTTSDPSLATAVTPVADGAAQVSMTLRTGAQISGVVRSSDGAPLAAARVVAFVDDGAVPSRSAMTQPDGRYVIRGLLPGTYRVAVAPRGSARDGDWYYPSGPRPSTTNVSVVGIATTSGIDLTVPARPAARTFADVGPTYAFASYVSWLAARGISTGYAQPDGSWQFQPSTSVSREAMAAFLSRDLASPAYTPPASARFSDVPTSYPFYANVAWLADQGITTGFADGTFRPTDPVSREAMAAFLYRAAGSPSYTPPSSPRFSDVPVGHPFYTQISWLAEKGVSAGYADGTFHPNEAVSREAMAAFLYRADAMLSRVG